MAASAAMAAWAAAAGACTLEFDRAQIPENTESCLGTNPGAELYRDDFDGTLDAYTTVAGTWTLAGSELEQSNSIDAATLLASVDVGADYRVVASLRMLASGQSGGAMELVARATDATHFYHCNWEPETGDFEIQDVADNMPLVQRTITLGEIPGYDAHQSITMELQVQGNDIRCCLRDVPSATLSLTNGTYASGSIGFQTWFLSAAYDSLRVYRSR